jgi:hypothetical protein
MTSNVEDAKTDAYAQHVDDMLDLCMDREVLIPQFEWLLGGDTAFGGEFLDFVNKMKQEEVEPLQSSLKKLVKEARDLAMVATTFFPLPENLVSDGEFAAFMKHKKHASKKLKPAYDKLKDKIAALKRIRMFGVSYQVEMDDFDDQLNVISYQAKGYCLKYGLWTLLTSFKDGDASAVASMRNAISTNIVELKDRSVVEQELAFLCFEQVNLESILSIAFDSPEVPSKKKSGKQNAEDKATKKAKIDKGDAKAQEPSVSGKAAQDVPDAKKRKVDDESK